MLFVAAQWADVSRRTIRATRADGSECFVPASGDNADYRLITEGRASEEDDVVAPLDIAEPA